jgi:hypothetical protein
MLVAHGIGSDGMGDDAGGIGGEGLRWLTYGEMAKALRIKPASARRLAQRKPWPRRQNNRGEAIVGVPVDALPPRDGAHAVAGDVAPVVASDIAPDAAGDAAPDAVRTIATLAEHIARLGRELDALRIVADAAREEGIAREALAIEVEALKATLALVEAERDRWCREAGRSVLSRLFGRRAA